MSTQNPAIRVLIVEDEPAAAEALVLHVGRVPGFGVAGHVSTGADALRRVVAGGVDLVLLDIYLPDMSGLEVLRRLRAAGLTVDVVATTRARDLSVVQAAVSFGVTQYLVKPFTSAAVRQKLDRYAAYRASLADAGPARRPGRDRQPLRRAARDRRERGPAQGDQPRVVADGRHEPAHRPGTRRAGRATRRPRTRSAPGPRRRSPGSWGCRG